MRYKTLKIDGIGCQKADPSLSCAMGFVGESSYHCKHCLGVKDTDDGKFVKAGDTGSEFDHVTTCPAYVWDRLRFLCNKLGEKVWVKV